MGSEKKLTLTEAGLRERAKSYVSLETKKRFLADCAMRCFDKMEIGTETGETLPPFYKENGVSKAKYMMSALVSMYLGEREADISGDNPWELTDEEYDSYAESFPLSQLERIKKTTQDKDLRDKIYDLLVDYRLLEKLLNAECYGLLPAMNDTLSRFQMMMTMQSTPEAMDAVLASLDEVRKEVEEIKRPKT